MNGDGRPDLFVAGYTDMQHPVPGSVAGFPTNHEGVRDLLFLNEGKSVPRGRRAGRASIQRRYDHSLGAVFSDFNDDGRPDLYVANDEDPNRLYLNVARRPARLPLRRPRAGREGRGPNAGMGIAADTTATATDLFVTNSRRQTHAVYSATAPAFTDVAHAVHGRARQPHRAGATRGSTSTTTAGSTSCSRRRDPRHEPREGRRPAAGARAARGRTFADAGVVRDLRTNGRGVAAADYDDDGRVDLAVNTIGGKLILLHNTSKAGHWLEVQVAPFSPGAVVTVVGVDGRRQVREVRAGSSYLSSEDPRVHFGLGAARTVRELDVRYPDGTVKRLRDLAADRVVTVER